MKFSVIFCLVLAIATLGYGAQKLSKAAKDSIKAEIEAMLVTDQQYRWMIMFGETDSQKLEQLRALPDAEKFKRIREAERNKVGISKTQKDSLENLQEQIDNLNYNRLLGIFKNYDYPSYADQEAISTILIHNCHAVSDSTVSLLKAAAIDGSMPAIEYAIFYDTRQIRANKPELYYVLEHFNKETGTSTTGHPIDLNTTNTARKEIGLNRLK